MSETEPPGLDLRLPRYSRVRSLLRLSLWLGAGYDAGFALLMFFAPELGAGWFGLPTPGEPFYLWLIAVLLLMLAGVYLLAAYDPVAYGGNVVVAILGRSAGALVFFVAAWGRPELAGLYVLASADLLFAVAHALFWWPIRRPGSYSAWAATLRR